MISHKEGTCFSLALYLRSWTTAHRRPWRFCCFLVSLYWFLQHFVFFSPCLWSVFHSFFISFQCFFATFWTFFSEFYTLLMLRCELSSWKFTRSWCYVVNFPLGGVLGGVITFCRLRSSWRRSVDATLWTFFLEVYTVLMLRCQLSSQSLHALDATLWTFFLEVLHALDATLWTFFSEFYTLLMLRCELSSWKFCTLLMLRCELSSQSFTRSWCYVVNFLLESFARSWCYVVNFLLRILHVLDATLWTFFLELYTLLMLRCELSSWGGFGGGLGGVLGGGVITFCRLRSSWRRSVDATLWTFFLEVYTILMLRCELSSWKVTRSWCYVVNFLLRVLHALDATLWTFFSEFCSLLMLRCELSSQSFTRSWCYVMNFLLRVLHALDATLWTLDKASYLWTLKDLCLNSADCWSRIERQWKKWKERTDGPHWPYIPNMV